MQMEMVFVIMTQMVMVVDEEDIFPNDPTECCDSDGDGVGDNSDECEGFDDNIDSDGDGVCDGCDDFPNDSTETTDTDGDGVDG